MQIKTEEGFKAFNDTHKFATFETGTSTIPNGSIIVFGGSWHLKDGSPSPHDSLDGHSLNATIDLLNAVILKYQVSHCITILADSLAAHHETADPTELAELRKTYSNSGAEYISAHKNHFKAIYLKEELKLITHWEDWRANKVLADYILGKQSHESYRINTETPDKDNFSDVPHLKNLDNTTASSQANLIKNIRPSIDSAIEYMKYIYENKDCTHHNDFKKHIDEEVHKRVNKKIRESFGNTPAQDSETQDAINKIKQKESPKIINFCLEECAQHFILGVLAHRLNKHIRVFHVGSFTGAFRFIQDKLIGLNWDTNQYYLDVVEVKIFHKKDQSLRSKSNKFFNPNEFFEALVMPPHLYSLENKLLFSHSNATDNVCQNDTTPMELINQATILLCKASLKELKSYEKTIQSILKDQPKIKNSSTHNQKAASPRYHLSQAPEAEEVFPLLYQYFSRPETSEASVTNFLCFIQKKIQNKSPKNSPSVLRPQKNNGGNLNAGPSSVKEGRTQKPRKRLSQSAPFLTSFSKSDTRSDQHSLDLVSVGGDSKKVTYDF